MQIKNTTFPWTCLILSVRPYDMCHDFIGQLKRWIGCLFTNVFCLHWANRTYKSDDHSHMTMIEWNQVWDFKHCLLTIFAYFEYYVYWVSEPGHVFHDIQVSAHNIKYYLFTVDLIWVNRTKDHLCIHLWHVWEWVWVVL